MSYTQIRPYAIHAVHRLPDGTLHQKSIFETNDRDTWLNVQRTAMLAAPKKHKRTGPNGRERKVFVVAVDGAIANRAKACDQLKRIPLAGEEFPSIAALCEALGISPATVNMYFYRATKAGKEGEPIRVHGVFLNYVPRLEDKVSV